MMDARIGSTEAGAIWPGQIILGCEEVESVKIVSAGDPVIVAGTYSAVALRGLVAIGESRWYVQTAVAYHAEHVAENTRPVWTIHSKKFD